MTLFDEAQPEEAQSAMCGQLPPKKNSITDFPMGTLVMVTAKNGTTWVGSVNGRAPGSHSKLIVEDIDRGPGYHEQSGTYKGVKVRGGWYRGENYSYGQEQVVHKNQLTEYVHQD